MDRIVSKYEKFFSIRFTHPVYPFSPSPAGTLGDLLSLEPDEPTSRLFRKHDIHTKIRHDELLCFVRVQDGLDAPLFRLPTSFSARFFLNLKEDLARKTNSHDSHGKENIYRFRINVRASANSMDLATASLGTQLSREPIPVFEEGNPGTWSSTFINLSGHYGIIDIVTEGSSTHRLYSDVNNQELFYTAANGNEHEQLFTIHLNN